MESVTLRVEGMNCGHCQAKVTSALKAVAGVADAKVDLRAGEATVTYDPGRVALSQLKAAVDEAGYTLVVP